MAKTFTLTSSSYEGRYMELTCTQVSNGSSANSSTINWTLSTKGGGSTWYSTGPTEVIINGSKVYTKSRVEWYGTGTPSSPVGVFPAKAGSVSGSLLVSHNNDGTKSINVSFSTAIFVGSASASTYKGTWTLDSIPRYANISKFEVAKRNETSVYVRYEVDKTCDKVQYSKNDGSSWVDLPSDGIVSGLSANTTYNFKLQVKAKDSQLWTVSNRVQQTTYDYPHIGVVEVKTLKIGEKQTLSLYNPLMRNITINMYQDSNKGTLLYSGTTNTNDIEFTPNANKLYESIPSSKTGKAVYSAVYGSIYTHTTTGDYKYEVKESECYPTFNDFTYKDVNTNVTNITGNDQVIVKGLSTLQVNIASSNKMVAKNYASPSKYIATIGNLNKSINYSENDVNLNVGVVNSAGTQRLTVTAYDSRNIAKSVYKDITVYDYVKPVVNVDVTRLNNFESETTLKINGSYTSLIVDSVDKNGITEVSYRYRESKGEWTDWIVTPTTVTKNNFTCNDVILSLDNTKAFDIEVKATDKLSNNVASGSIDVGEAIFFISSNKKACYINGELVKGSVVVSAEKPTEGEEIWIQKGKNKVPTDFSKWESGHYGLDGTKENNEQRVRLTDLIKVEPNTVYYVDTFNNDYNFVIRGFDKNKTFTYSVGGLVNGSSFTTKSDTYYLGVAIYNPTGVTSDYESYKTSFQNASIKPLMYLNSETNKTYEEYVNKTMYIKNNNDVYEEFLIEDNNIKRTIYTGKLLGGNSVTLSGTKRYLEVHVVINFGTLCGTIIYVIDTILGYVVCGSGLHTAFDGTDMLVYYVSESKFDKNTNTFTHTRVGFFNIGTQVYSNRNNNGVYYVNRIETYD